MPVYLNIMSVNHGQQFSELLIIITNPIIKVKKLRFGKVESLAPEVFPLAAKLYLFSTFFV